ncbi:MAG TPA: tyrosine-protein phosphatase [Gaiellaceae bacterium]
MATRDLVWDGCINVRDLGGLPTEDGRSTRSGSVIRADSVGLLSRAGWEAVAEAGVARIVDLRQEDEAVDDPPRELPIEVVDVPIFDGLDDEDWATVEALAAGAATSAESQRRVYLHFLDRARHRFVAAVAAVAGAPEGAVVVHCHGGKDRTGIVVALLLRLAGVPIDVIAADYALSGERLRPRHERWFASAESDEERARIERIAATPVEAMHAVLETLDQQYGGVERYLLDGGLPPETVEAARSRLR